MNAGPRPSALISALYPGPAFLVLGTQKGGTTSLHEHLCRHPQVRAAREKEVHYFDHQYHRGPDWYLRRFPSLPARLLGRLRSGDWPVSGDATPMYLFHPLAAGRIARLLPRTRLIVLLRDPVQRAYSHYQHNLREGWETLPFEEALACEDERIAPSLAALHETSAPPDTRLAAYSYRARGRYLEQLQRYEAVFPREQLLVLCSEEFFANPQATYRAALEFLGLTPFTPRLEPANQGNYGPASPAAQAAMAGLRRYFAPHNEALFRHIGYRMPWN